MGVYIVIIPDVTSHVYALFNLSQPFKDKGYRTYYLLCVETLCFIRNIYQDYMIHN